MDVDKKIILCDWQDTLYHYNLPKNILKKINNLCKDNNHKFILSHDITKSNLNNKVVAYIGNRPSNDLLNIKTLKWIHFGSVGVDKIDINQAKKKNIFITNAKGIFDKSVSHMAFYKLFELLNANVNYNADFNRKFWEKKSVKLDNCEINILGYGGIAKSLLSLLINTGAKINIFTNNPKKYSQSKLFTLNNYSKIKSLAKNQKNSILINLLPLAHETSLLINKKLIYHFDEILCYLNLGRLDTENHDNIIDSLIDKKIKKAYWDVIRDENHVQKLKNKFPNRVLFTPHISSFLYDHWNKTSELTEFNLRKFFDKEFKGMKNIVR